MAKRRLIEGLEAQITLAASPVDLFPRMVAEWATRTSYPELSALLVHLRCVSMVHQTHHWQAKGDPFYGDHLLFERLYDGTVGEIDSIAERSVGLGTTANVDLQLVTTQLQQLAAIAFPPDVQLPTPSSLIARSHRVEMGFLNSVAGAVESMKAQGTLTRGLDNLLAGIEDSHEGHVYLLKQRLSQ